MLVHIWPKHPAKAMRLSPDWIVLSLMALLLLICFVPCSARVLTIVHTDGALFQPKVEKVLTEPY